MFLKFVRIFFGGVLRLIARVEMIGYENIPTTGGAIVVSNHLGRLDAMLVFILSDRDDIIMLVAEKYRQSAIWRWAARKLDAIWLNRFEPDLKALREATRRLRQGGILAMAPEGTRSVTGAMQPAKQGAAFLAAKAGVPVVPAAIQGTEDRRVLTRLRRLRRLHIIIRIGESFHLPPMDRSNRDAYLQAQTDEMMCRIGALLPESHRGAYADHPRLQELLAAPAP